MRQSLMATAAASVLTLVMAACGGSDSGRPESTSQTSGTGQAAGTSVSATGKPIKVMFIAPYDNPVIDWSQGIRGAKAAAAAINAEGGIGGRPIKVVSCNDSLDPNKAARCARKAGSERAVATIADSLFTSLIYPILEKSQTPAIGNFVTEAVDAQSEIAYPIFPGSNLVNRAWPGVLKEQHGFNSMAAVVEGRASTVTDVKVMKEGAGVAGIDFKGAVGLPPETTDFSPKAKQLNDLGADATVALLSERPFIGLLTSAAELGYDKPLASLGWAVMPSMLKSLGDRAEGLLTLDQVPPASAGDQIPAIAQFNKEMDAADMNGENDRNSVGIQGWLAMHAIGIVAARVDGAVDKKSLKAELDTNTPVDLLGLLEWTPAAAGPGDYRRLSNGQLYTGEVKGGKVVLTSPDPVDGFELAGVK
jgi:branched-chain amino acid transport system substrate-binding protein